MVEGTMTHTLSRIILCFFALLFISQLPTVTTNSLEALPYDFVIPEKHPDLLIILSPQYALDDDIYNAINIYISAVKNDLSWTSKIIPLSAEENTYQQIDDIIENAYTNSPLKACLMVGEDLSTALGGDSDYLEQPSVLPWSTLGGTTSYDSIDQGIICRPTTYQICVSLLYPSAERTYEEKKSDIISAFHKFATQRHTTYPETLRVFESSELNTNSQAIYQDLSSQMNLLYSENPSEDEMTQSLQETYSAFFVHGHSNPTGTDVNKQKKTGWFSAENLDTLQTPFFGADGCYAAGWWSDQQDNDQLDTSIDSSWYGSKIFTSQSIQVMALGLLSQNGFSAPVSFIENVMPELLEGTTLAEAMIGDTFISDTIIIGDPTFHFSV
jgi:hypothetical protein